MKSRNQPRGIQRSRAATCLCLLLWSSIIVTPIAAAEPTAPPPMVPPVLGALIEEALARSPIVIAARNHWQAQTKVPIQARTISDPQVQFQQLSVGGPAPFEGYETSDFFYNGFGVSQDIPWPGKLSLQGSIAEKEAEYSKNQYETARREVVEKVRESFYELFFLKKEEGVLALSRDDLGRIEQIAETRYRVGEGVQQDVVKAQLHMSEILKQQAMVGQETGQMQAQLKAEVGRDVDSRDIEVGEVEATTLRVETTKVVELANTNSPEIAMERAMEERSREALKLARKGYMPDFSVGYMFQRTGPGLRDYYMLSLGAKIPLYFWRKQIPAIEQASLESLAAQAQVRARELSVSENVQSQLVALQAADRVLSIYREALVPQANSSLEAALAAYRVGKVDFQTLLSAFIDLHEVRQEYYRELADHEIAIAKISQSIGERP